MTYEKRSFKIGEKVIVNPLMSTDVAEGIVTKKNNKTNQYSVKIIKGSKDIRNEGLYPYELWRNVNSPAWQKLIKVS